MTSEAAKRAAELANVCKPNGFPYEPYTANNFEEGSEIGFDAEAFRKYIQHVSDVAEQVHKDMGPAASQWASLRELRTLILPKPVDLIAELFREAFADSNIGEFNGYWKVMAKFRELAAKRGLTIAPIGEQP